MSEIDGPGVLADRAPEGAERLRVSSKDPEPVGNPANGNAKTRRPAAVYFVQCNGPDGPIKIGQAVAPERRLSELRIGCPYPMELLAIAICDDADLLERRLHAAFKSARIHGEWFRCTPELLRTAKRVHAEGSRQLAEDMLAVMMGNERRRASRR